MFPKLYHTKYSLLKILILTCLPVWVNATSQIEIPVQKDWKVILVKELEVMPDENKYWTFEKILQSSDSLFSPNLSKETPSLHTYWARFNLKNPGIGNELLTLESNFWDFVSVYIVDSNGQVDKLNLGLLNKKSNSRFDISGNSEVMILAKFESNGNFRREDNINLIISKVIPAVERSEFRNYIDGILFGIIFGLAFYNLFLYVSLRDTTYLWYTGYLFLLAISLITFCISTPSKLVQYFIPTYPYIAFLLYNIGQPLLYIFYIQFTRHFLQSKVRYPTWDLLLKFMMGLFVLLFTITLFNLLQFRAPDRVELFILNSLVCLMVSVKSYLKGFEKAKFFLFGQIFVLLGHIIAFISITNLALFSFLPKNEFYFYFLTPKAFWTGAAIETVVFSLALANKYNLLQRDITRVTIEKEQEKQVMLASQNEMLEKQVDQRTIELSKSIERLKITQAQLIHAEKMASLGELTAGIAHEIQNPLNFINNFSEINVELIEELQSDRSKIPEERDESNQSQIVKNLSKNSEKINHHGKRVDAIVKGMLQHSRKSSAIKELTDINALCEECLKLAYHGFRAKENSFTLSFETAFDPEIPKVKILPQDIGRVILNIITNAFYAVNNKRKNLIPALGTDHAIVTEFYQPKVIVSTKKTNHEISIVISDNGPGIPANIVDKIFQPFFTTKPAGEGTGLGLSMAYDIVTNGHNGMINVISKEGLGTEFEVILPLDESVNENNS